MAWLHQLAVRGCLIAGVVLLTAGIGPCESQERAQERAAIVAEIRQDVGPEQTPPPSETPDDRQDKPFGGSPHPNVGVVSATPSDDTPPDDEQESKVSDSPKWDRFFGDTVAQWVMAGTGILALLLSSLAVIFTWINIKIGRESAQDQIRPYVMAKDVSFSLEKADPVIRLDMLNTGNSPTRNTKHSAWLIVEFESSAINHDGISIRDKNRYPGKDIAPGGGFERWRFDFNEKLLPLQARVTTPHMTVRTKVLAAYDDVFGRHHEEPFYFKGKVPAGWKLGTKVDLRPDSEAWNPDDGYNTD